MKLPSVISQRLVRRTLWGLLAALILFAAAGFLLAPPLLKSYLTRTLTAKLHRTVSIRSVRVNPFAFSATLRGCEIRDRDGASPFVAFDALYVRASVKSLLERAPVLSAIRLRGPRLTVVRYPDGTYNFSDLLTAAPETGARKAPLRYSLNNIRVAGGALSFDDRLAKARHEVTQVQMGISFLSNLPDKIDIDTRPAFHAVVDGEPVSVEGEAKPFSKDREAVLHVDLHDLDLAKYLAYLPSDVGFRVVSGRLDSRARLTWRQRPGQAPELVLGGRVGLRDLRVTERDGKPLLSAAGVDAMVVAWNLLSGKGHVSRLDCDGVDLNVRRAADGALNLETVAGPPGPPPPAGARRGGLDVVFSEIDVGRSAVRFEDDSVRPPFRTTLAPVTLTVKDLDTALDRPAAVEGSFTTEAGEALQASATLRFSPLGAEGTLAAKGVELPRYGCYDRDALPFEVKEGKVDFDTGFSYAEQGGESQVAVTGLSATATSLNLRLPGETEDFFQAPTLSVRGVDLDTARRTAHVGALTAEGGRLRATRSTGGSVDLSGLVAASAGGTAARQAWAVTLDRLGLERFRAELEDHAPSKPATVALAGVALDATGLSTVAGPAGSVRLRAGLEPHGLLEASGPLSLTPFSASLSVTADRLALMAFEPYLSDVLAVQLTDGSLSARGKLSAAAPAQGPARASFAGDVHVDQLATVDKASLEDFLNWKSLYLGGVQAQMSPVEVSVREAALSDFYSRLIVSPDGTLNLAQIVSANEPAPPAAAGPKKADAAQEPPATAPSAPPAPPPYQSIQVQSVTLAGGTINFTDHFIKPNYDANLTEVAGRVSGLSSQEGTKADLEVRAHLDHQAPIEVTGQINPLSREAYLAIKGTARDIELSPMSPYSGRYAGYLIEKGKLNMDVTYHLEHGKLDAENHLFLDQFTFGDKVDSPEATKLPVKLAVALLKDRQGRIDLQIPVSGSLNDPKFKLGRIILRIIVNLLAKVATSPFALLGHLFGHGESLSFVTFAPGRATLDPAGLEKVAQLEKALYDRPALTLDITGRFDPDKDREGLRRAMLERDVKARKFAQLLKEGQAPQSVDEVQVSPEEYPKYLAQAYKHGRFPKPRNILGMAKELPVPEMEQLMLANAKVTAGDLAQLAAARAQTVKDALLKPGRVKAERVFLSTDAKPAPEAAQAGLMRVDFSLR